MKRSLFVLGLCLVVAGLAFVAPAQATTCGGIEFSLVAQDKIGMGEPSIIGLPLPVDNGNVLVTSATGIATVGSSTVIIGKLFAATIDMKTGAQVLECHGNVIGDATGCGAVFPFDPPAACLGTFPPPPLVVPAANPCVDTSANRTFNAVNNGTPTNDLAEGCYKALRLNAGAIVRLTGPGASTFLSIKLLGGSELRSSTPGTKRTVNVNKNIETDPNTKFTDLLINVAGTQGSMVLANNTLLTNTTINSPFRNIHPRTGTKLLACSELIGDTLTVEPITAECGAEENFCKCDDGFHFAVTTCTDDAISCIEARRCVPDVD